MEKVERLEIDLPVYDEDNAQVGDIVRLVDYESSLIDSKYSDQLIEIEKIVKYGFRGVVLLSNIPSQPEGFRGTYWNWISYKDPNAKLYLYKKNKENNIK